MYIPLTIIVLLFIAPELALLGLAICFWPVTLTIAVIIGVIYAALYVFLRITETKEFENAFTAFDKNCVKMLEYVQKIDFKKHKKTFQIVGIIAFLIYIMLF